MERLQILKRNKTIQMVLYIFWSPCYKPLSSLKTPSPNNAGTMYKLLLCDFFSVRFLRVISPALTIRELIVGPRSCDWFFSLISSHHYYDANLRMNKSKNPSAVLLPKANNVYDNANANYKRLMVWNILILLSTQLLLFHFHH